MRFLNIKMPILDVENADANGVAFDKEGIEDCLDSLAPHIPVSIGVNGETLGAIGVVNSDGDIILFHKYLQAHGEYGIIESRVEDGVTIVSDFALNGVYIDIKTDGEKNASE